MTTDPHPWPGELSSLHAQVWLRLGRAVHDRHSAARHPTLATVTPDGRPQARTVVLRAADAKTATLELHTDLSTAKVAELRHQPLAALHIWDSSAHLQTRIEARVTILDGADVADHWARVPEPSRQSYGIFPAPGTPISTALEYGTTSDAARFAVLRCDVQTIDVLHLGPNHRRARFERQSGWSGTWLAP